ncbi:VPS10 domain-containing protein [Pontibacter sp. G13]|uniref:VPS10 domain-containing protein n=1 Tax=Pontibacter sp. G13 TaxID=3074898 RepID=UPI002889924D|nr:T9SS type A sorting domain-containing protein [Pontibacter sp. G13]WNJ16565.1 T9SS type A sorting domain-containing protein [Pontibacter sp. G13]
MTSVKQTLLILLAIVFAGNLHAQYGGGAGTDTDPYLIITTNDLVTLSTTQSDWQGKHFRLMQDLDMSGIAYTPIGKDGALFTGVFDGNGHTISNLTVTQQPTSSGTAMFGKSRGDVLNLGLIDVNIVTTGVSRVAGIIGHMDGGTLSRCYVQGGTIDVGTFGWAGSLVGVMWNTTIDTAYIIDCYATASVTANWGSAGAIGAIRGQHTIDRVAFYGSISNNVAIAQVQDDDPGAGKNGLPPTHAFYAASIGANDEYGDSLSTAQLLDPNSYTTFDFANTWMIDSTLGYAVFASYPSVELTYFDLLRVQRSASVDTIVWKNFGPGLSGYCEEFWCHPTDTNVMFMGPDMHSAFGTWDNGQTWETLKDWDGTGVRRRRIHDIVFSRTNPDFGLMLEREGEIFETQDRGRTWTVVADLGNAHTKMAIHPTNDSIWFVGAGDFWNVKANHRSLAEPAGIMQDRADYGYVWKTVDHGATWTQVADSLDPTLDVGRIIFNPNQPDSMIMATGQGMYISADGGETWTSSATGLPNDLPRDLTSYYDAQTGEFILYAIEQSVYTPNGTSIDTDGGVFKSTDGGMTWTSITGNLGIDLQTITNATVRGRFHRAVSYWLGVDQTVSEGTYTDFPSQTLPVFNRIVVNPLNKDEIYISHNKKHDYGFGPGDVWKTEDGGQTWVATARNGAYWISEEDKSYWDGRTNPTGANIDFAHLQRYMDEGSEGSGTRSLAINAAGEVYTGIDQQTLKSSNGGQSWAQIDDIEIAPGSETWLSRGGSALPGRFMLLETGVEGRKLFCSGEHGLWENASVQTYPDIEAVPVRQLEGQIHPGGAHSISTVAVHPTDPQTIYMLMWRQEHRGKLRRSTDGGQTWENIATIFEGSNNSWENLVAQSSLLIDPNEPDNMYFTAIRKPISEVTTNTDESILTLGEFGVYKSTDGGFTWAPKKTGLPAEGSVRRLTMHPQNHDTLYASLNKFGANDTFGLYMSADKGENWSPMALPMEIEGVNNLFIDRNTGYYFLSAGFRSGAYGTGGVYRSMDQGATWERIFNAPYVWQTEVSPADSNLILVTVAAQIPSIAHDFLNPGLYLSRDGGQTWDKINQGLAHSDRIVDAKPDPVDTGILWAAGWGSGWYKAIIGPTMTVAPTVDIETPEENLVWVYPNPVSNGTLRVEGMPDRTLYTIIDIQGRVVATGNTGIGAIDVSRLSPGLHILQLKEQDSIVNIKFMVAR